MSDHLKSKSVQEHKEEKILAARQVEKLTKELVGDSDWSLLQILLQEICATFVCKDQKRPSVNNLLSLLKDEINLRYADDERVKTILLDGIPSNVAIHNWLKRDGWDEAVWAQVRTSGMFTAEKRASLIDALYKRGKDKSDSAAKLWLTLSGDYSEKIDVTTDDTVEKFRELQQAIFSKKDK
jgi:hypothetical protein